MRVGPTEAHLDREGYRILGIDGVLGVGKTAGAELVIDYDPVRIAPAELVARLETMGLIDRRAGYDLDPHPGS
jgi:hypothetical protein